MMSMISVWICEGRIPKMVLYVDTSVAESEGLVALAAAELSEQGT
jgi:hypothetical protein